MSPAAADRLWEHVSEVLFCTKEQYLASLADWLVVETSAGVVMTKGTEIHFAGWRKPIGTRRLIRQHLGGLVAQYGHATTRVPKGRTAGHAFVTRLGFIKTHEDSLDVHYRIERMKHV